MSGFCETRHSLALDPEIPVDAPCSLVMGGEGLIFRTSVVAGSLVT